jgi:hypothetical protein
LSRYGLTWSMCRGNLVCTHPTRARSDRVGLAFQRYIDATEPVSFKCVPGDVYVNNNHRCLHGRQAFHDPTRRFTRFLFWFVRPMPAPSHLIELASQGAQALARRLEGEPRWVLQLMGVDAAQPPAQVAERAARVVDTLMNPTNCDDWQGPGQSLLLLQEALLSALWPVLSAPLPGPAEMHARLEALIGAQP